MKYLPETMDKEQEIKIDKVTYTVERHFSPRIPLKELLVKQIASVKKKEDAKRTSDTDEIAWSIYLDTKNKGCG